MSTARTTLSRLRLQPFQTTPSHLLHHHVRTNSTFSSLSTSLPARTIPIIYDHLNPTPSHLLNASMTDIFNPTKYSSHLQSSSQPTTRPPLTLPTTTSPTHLPPTHHLIYFPPAIPSPLLLPDGTDPLQSPGPPFTRRMWAGGSLRLNLSPSLTPLLLNSARAACVETIRDVTVKGKEGQEKVFVGIERRVGLCTSEDESEESVRVRLAGSKEGAPKFSEEEFGEAALIERRNIVFMREAPKRAAQGPEGEKKSVGKTLDPPAKGDAVEFRHTFTPDSKLLFRYSALTWNAHAIHLDTAFCRDVEGHRNLLFHGPLSFTVMMTALRHYRLAKDEEVEFVEYRNLAPLYAGEPLSVAGRQKEEGKYEVWVETPQGALAVRGLVRTKKVAEKRRYADLEMLAG